MDVELLYAGMEYQALPDVYVIFICDHDPFGQGLYRYTFDMVCKEADYLRLKDGSHTIFLSTRGKNDARVPPGLVKFLKFVRAGLEESTEDFDDEYVRRLQTSVQNIKTSREMEERFMLWEEMIKEEREEAKTEGRIESAVENIFEVLSGLEEKIPSKLRQRIQEEEDIDTLRAYFRKALKSRSVEEFMEVIQ